LANEDKAELKPETPMIRVFVVADSAILQSGLEAIVGLSPELIMIGRANVLSAALLADFSLTADVVLLAVELTATNLSEVEPLLEENLPPIVWLLDPQDPWAIEAWRLGVQGLLPNDATAAEILAAIEATAAGLIVLHPDIAPLARSAAPRSLLAPLSQPLTDREVEVLQMLAEGMANKTIARQLHISEHTVKFHISSIFAKLQVSSRTEAVTIGIRQGLILL
jgi:two-component system, NarL family, response regulator YdfI